MLPNIKSAAKRVKGAKKRAARNMAARSSMRTAIKKYEAQVTRGDTSGAGAALGRVMSIIDKAAKKGVIHKNQADRRKSRLARKLSALAGKDQPGGDAGPA